MAHVSRIIQRRKAQLWRMAIKQASRIFVRARFNRGLTRYVTSTTLFQSVNARYTWSLEYISLMK